MCHKRICPPFNWCHQHNVQTWRHNTHNRYNDLCTPRCWLNQFTKYTFVYMDMQRQGGDWWSHTKMCSTCHHARHTKSHTLHICMYIINAKQQKQINNRCFILHFGWKVLVANFETTRRFSLYVLTSAYAHIHLLFICHIKFKRTSRKLWACALCVCLCS